MELREAFTETRADVADLLDQVRALAALAGQPGVRARARAPRPANAPAVRRLIRDAIEAYARQPFELEVPGSHYSGLSNQDLFDVLARQNRMFLKVTPGMRDHARRACLEEFATGDTVPLRIELDETWRAACEEVVEARMEGRLKDVPIRGLTPAYARRKARDGYGGQPVGQRKGRLFAAVARIRVRRGRR